MCEPIPLRKICKSSVAEILSSSDSSVKTANVGDLRRVRDNVPLRLWAVAFIGFWERAAFWGLTAPWQNYLEHGSKYTSQETPGALGLGQAMATRIYCGFYVFYYVTPVFIAIIADSYLGRYKTLIISIVIYCLGCTVLTVSSIPTNLDKGWGLPGLVLAMVLIGIGGGGFKAITAPFIADQYIETKPRIVTLKSGEKVITDYHLTLQYIYNLYYWLGNVGSLSWFATVYIEKHLGFTGAYGLTLGFMGIATLLLICGRRWYIRLPHEGNIVPQATKILSCVCRNGFKMTNAYPEYQSEHFQKTVPWSRELVGELARGLRACRVLLAFVMFYVCFDQMQNNLISQAGQMKTNGTPNDLLPAMNQVGCIVLGPLIQEVFYPFLHRRRIYLGPITRMTIGFVFVALSMLYAMAIQHSIYKSPPCYNRPDTCDHPDSVSSRPNVWIQAPLYFLMSAGEIFALVTGMEYAYDYSPKDMKVIVQAVSLLIAGLASAIAMALTTVAHDPNLSWFYGSLTGLMTVTAVIFWIIFRRSDNASKTSDQEAPSET
ncbi:PTR2-domain-containing protein [Dothidotthia symphoricarpi CBS 119687]|uniref:PTR2-domain-containing protein n=1 Tax=Dothidotthia symphoricarpi CBS 119687 TaxID=1392245 RepID=A0A6A6A308_9PLEO|nr:PTR2-domain-containing protein [Dothidotthia symphoricarpi CBS 119687]KAF2126190.1 PTR2-domain-containing protein [Dothidotthia symphoricarpi CBS 119687]